MKQHSLLRHRECEHAYTHKLIGFVEEVYNSQNTQIHIQIDDKLRFNRQTRTPHNVCECEREKEI